MKTWIVVAHRAGARIVLQQGDDPMRVIETLDNPAGRIHDRASNPGQPASERGGRGSEPQAVSRSHIAKTFANELAQRLQSGRNGNEYRELVLIAAPRFLGLLRAALDNATTALVRGTLDKGYAGLNDRELVARLDKM